MFFPARGLKASRRFPSRAHRASPRRDFRFRRALPPGRRPVSGDPVSRAFVKETSESARPPERMVDEGPNLVTPEGMAQIAAHVTRIENALKTESNVLLRETLERDLRYWTVRLASAEIVPPPSGDAVSFGSKVT